MTSTGDARHALRQDFAARCGIASWQEVLLAGDASFRKYWRRSQAGQTLVIMDAPPPQEDVRPFVRIARHLNSLGLSAPIVMQEDDANGFLLLEDFGDDTYARVLARRLPASSGGDEAALYRLAVEVLAHLHHCGDRALLADLPHYLGARMAELAAVLVDWYLPLALGRDALPGERADYLDAWQAVLARLDRLPRTLTLRDYHIDNLMWLPRRAGVQACGLLDIQDAETGVAAYDLASLVEDARRDIADDLRHASLQHYSALTGDSAAALDSALAICAAQRHSRVIGVFARLWRRDGKPQYLRHLPRLWSMYDRALHHEELAPVRNWIADLLPPARRVFPQV